MPKYPNIEVRLTENDGNAFFIIGRVTKSLRRANVPQAEIDDFQAKAKSGDYDHFLRTCMEWVTIS